METKGNVEINEIEEEEEQRPLIASPNNQADASPTFVRDKVPQVEIHLYRQGKGPIDVFKSKLGGWDQDQLEVRDILEKYGLKSIYAFNAVSGRSVPIRFHPRNGRSILTYKDGSVVHIDGEPKDSLMKPVTKILVSVAVTTLLITLVVKENPDWLKKINFTGGSISPWVLTCAVIVFTRLRKRTKDLMQNRGK